MEAREVTGIRARCDRIVSAIDTVLAGSPLQVGDAPARLRELLGAPPDFTVWHLEGQADVVYLSTIVDQALLTEAVLQPLAHAGRSGPPQADGSTLLAETASVRTYGDAADGLLAGKAVVIFRNRPDALAVTVSSWPKRGLSEPPAEVLMEGPHSGFVEDLQTNLALMRHRVRQRALRLQKLLVGRKSPTTVVLLWVDGLARPALVARVRRQLRRSDLPLLTDSYLLAQTLSRRSGVLFPTVGSTQRPDTAAAALLEGRVAVLAEGSPVALLMPNLLVHLIHAPEDYYNRAFEAVLKRLLRVFGMGVSLAASPVFVALVMVNRELVPTQLFISIAQARSGVPLAVLAEVMILEILVEVIREAGMHLPGNMGQIVSIVGAVIIGQSAVLAGLVSAPVVVVVSVSFITSFVLPSSNANLALRAIRYPLILLGASFGIFGVAWGLALVLSYLSAIESFGVPYLAPLSPLRPRGLQDALWRAPVPRMRRPFYARRRRAGGSAA